MHTLYTIGYSGWKHWDLIDAVTSRRAILADIRMSPNSRVPHWRGAALHEVLGVCYTHIPAFGNVNYRGGPIALAAPDAGDRAVRGLLEIQPVILLCGCPEVETCHRRVVADRFDTITDIVHLTPPSQGARQIAGHRGYYPIPQGEEPTTCKSCGAAIVWTRTAAGKAIPLDLAKAETLDGVRAALTHYATCPHGREWRR